MQKVILSVTIEKGTPLNQIKAQIHKVVNEAFGIPVETLHFKTKCCNMAIDFKIDDIPLEDYSCECGKTKFFEYKWIDKK
jgi:hypothetical protein